MTTILEFESDIVARNILGRLKQWGYGIEQDEQSGDKYHINHK